MQPSSIHAVFDSHILFTKNSSSAVPSFQSNGSDFGDECTPIWRILFMAREISLSIAGN